MSLLEEEAGKYSAPGDSRAAFIAGWRAYLQGGDLLVHDKPYLAAGYGASFHMGVHRARCCGLERGSEPVTPPSKPRTTIRIVRKHRV